MKLGVVIGVLVLSICSSASATSFRINLQDFKGSTTDSPLSNAFLECQGFTLPCNSDEWQRITGPNPLFNISLQTPQSVIADFTPDGINGTGNGFPFPIFQSTPNSAFAYYIELVEPGNPSVIDNWLGMRYMPGDGTSRPFLAIGLISDDGSPSPVGFTKIGTVPIQENQSLDVTPIFVGAGVPILGMGQTGGSHWEIVTTAFIPEPHMIPLFMIGLLSMISFCRIRIT